MLPNKERFIWIFIALAGVVITYLVSNGRNNKTSTQQNTTPTTCTAFPQPTSAIEVQANEWFISDIDQVLGRDQYKPEVINWKWDWFCEQYQEAITKEESWLNDPIEMAMKSQGYPVFENSGPNIVKSFFGKNSRMTIVILTYTNLPDDSIKDQEWRIDLVESGKKLWTIQWIGYRQTCRRTGSDDWVAKRCL